MELGHFRTQLPKEKENWEKKKMKKRKKKTIMIYDHEKRNQYYKPHLQRQFSFYKKEKKTIKQIN